jgi:hypothetical protein
MRLKGSAAVGAAVLTLGTTALGAASAQRPRTKLPKGSERVTLNPADFTTRITNPYWPMTPGSRWVYRETDSEGTKQRVVVTATNKTKAIANGVTARVVRDVATERGQPVEITDDWYAQDRAGNIWYLGEATTEYENAKPRTTAGSFEAGVDGAQAGVVMPARPRPGLHYRQEYYKGKAEDKARIVTLREKAEVPFGFFKRVLMTREVNPLSPRALEFKFYARGVGPVLAISVSGGTDREELVSFKKG